VSGNGEQPYFKVGDIVLSLWKHKAVLTDELDVTNLIESKRKRKSQAFDVGE